MGAPDLASIVHPFNNNWNEVVPFLIPALLRLQSYILSTTTETWGGGLWLYAWLASIVHPFNNNWNRSDIVTYEIDSGFNRTSFQQQLKLDTIGITIDTIGLQSYILSTTTETLSECLERTVMLASIVHPFNNNWNFSQTIAFLNDSGLQSYILSTTTETRGTWLCGEDHAWLQSYILSTTTETSQLCLIFKEIE